MVCLLLHNLKFLARKANELCFPSDKVYIVCFNGLNSHLGNEIVSFHYVLSVICSLMEWAFTT